MCYKNNNQDDDDRERDEAHNNAWQNFRRLAEELDFEIQNVAPQLMDVFVEINTPDISEDENGLSDSDSDSEVEDDPGICAHNLHIIMTLFSLSNLAQLEVIPRAERRPLCVRQLRQTQLYRSKISKKTKYAKDLIQREWNEDVKDDIVYKAYVMNLKTVFRPFASRERDIKRIGIHYFKIAHN